jgi:hypothetical protein
MASKSTSTKKTASRTGTRTTKHVTKPPSSAAATRQRSAGAKPTKPRRATPVEPSSPPTRVAVTRRVIFWDVENTSGEADLLRVLDHLKIDRLVQPTELFAIGNWRSIGAKIARLLGTAGARLVHSAPAVGVRDWSDLWIAVAAGQWLGRANAGDVLEVVSDDRAFDAVADAAAALGVLFKRTSYRALGGSTERPERPAPPLSRGQRRRAARRRASAGRASHDVREPHHIAPPAAARATVAEAPSAEDAAHAASQEQIRAALARLSGGDSTRWITLDALANTLRAEGFTRPPGSPRLVTRLRRVKDVEVSPNGMVRLANQQSAPESAPAAAPDEPTAESPKAPRKRPRRRRSRSSGSRAATKAEGLKAAPETGSSERFADPRP